jgi:hypothetical protein
MRQAAARTRRIARDPSRAGRHGGRLSWLGWLVLVNYLLLAVALLCAIVASFSLGPAG